MPTRSVAGCVTSARVRTRRSPARAVRTPRDAAIRRLRREVERLRKERDFLKKTAKYFAAKNEPDTE